MQFWNLRTLFIRSNSTADTFIQIKAASTSAQFNAYWNSLIWNKHTHKFILIWLILIVFYLSSLFWWAMRGNWGWAFKRPWRECASEPAAFLSAFEMNTLIVGISVFWSSISYASKLLWNPQCFAVQQSLQLAAWVQFRNHPGNKAVMNASEKCLTSQSCSLHFFSCFFPFLCFYCCYFPANLVSFTERIIFFSLLKGRRRQCWRSTCVCMFNSVLQGGAACHRPARAGDVGHT